MSLREVEEILLKQVIEVSYETIRRWTVKFGPQIASHLRRRQTQPGDIWHLDEVVVKIRGRKYWLWRAVDQNGLVLEEILQNCRSKAAAKRLLRRLIVQFGRPKRIVTPSRDIALQCTAGQWTSYVPILPQNVRLHQASITGRTKG